MIKVAATHKLMDVRTTLKGESLEEVTKLNQKHWKDFEVVGSDDFYQRFRKKHPSCDWDNAEIDAHYE